MSPTPDARISPAVAAQKYGDAQGNLLKGHGRQFSTLLFVEFTDPAHTRTWISQLLAGLSTGPSATTDTVKITSTAKQLADSLAFSANGQDAGLFTGLYFTAAGLAFLGKPLAHEFDQTPGLGRSNAFASGMRSAATRQLLHDSKPAPDPARHHDWYDAKGNPVPIHALLLLADGISQPTEDGTGSSARLDAAVAFMQQRSQSLGVQVRITQQGARLLEDGHDIEHFGYADGVSQPLYLTGNPSVAPHARDFALGAEDLVLVPDQLDPARKSFGSFLVFRKLAQSVAAFNNEEDVLLVNALHLPNPSSEGTKNFSGAMAVGRFENGTPLVLQATNGVDPQGTPDHPNFTNDFDYAHDQQGLRCPFHAHVRKVNPRGETGDARELKHRITRRGVPFGPALPDGQPEDGQSRGLLFICFQRSIGQQFEFLQQAWADSSGFVHGGVGLDPVVGQGNRSPLTFPTAWGQPGTRQAPFAQHVVFKGGDYFYAPSLSGLAALAGAPAA